MDERWVESVLIPWKVSKYGVFSGPYFPVFGLNTEIYGVNLRISRMQENTNQKKLHIWTLFTQCLLDFVHTQTSDIISAKDFLRKFGTANDVIRMFKWLANVLKKRNSFLTYQWKCKTTSLSIFDHQSDDESFNLSSDLQSQRSRGCIVNISSSGTG